MAVSIESPGPLMRLHYSLRHHWHKPYTYIRKRILDHLVGRPFREYLRHHYAHVGTPPLEQVKIETHTTCNKKCSFCPVPLRADNLRNKWMSMEVFNRIAEELERIDFTGSIFLSVNNEPLMDKRLKEMLRIIRSKVGNNQTALITNGLLLTPARVRGLFEAGLNRMIIDNYNDDWELIPPVRKIVEEFGDCPWNIVVQMRKESDTLDSEGGYLDNNPGPEHAYPWFCFAPFYEMIIGWNGDVPVCCDDVMYDGVVGNIMEEGIDEIWQGGKLAVYRKMLLKNKRELPPCDKCDWWGFSWKRVWKMMREKQS